MVTRWPSKPGSWQRAAFLVVLQAALASAILAGPARADEVKADPRVEARNKLVEGSELLRRGDYTEALIRFKAAYELVPSPKIFYNFALAYQNLGRTTEAIEAFEKFLDEAADAAPDTRANAERYKSELVPKIASVVVQCDAEGAEISVDGRPYGTTPRKNPIRLDPGPHSLIVEKAPLPAFTQRLDARAGQRIVVDAKVGAVAAPAAPVLPAAPPPVEVGPPPPVEPPSPPMPTKLKASIGLGAVAVLGLAFGVYEQLAASSKYGEFNSYVAPNPLGKCDADPRVAPGHGGGNCASLLSDGDSASLRAKIGLIAGGVLAASSVTLFILARRDAAEPTATASVGCLPTGPGVACAFTF